MQVRIENKSSASITVKGRHTIRIPEHGVYEANLPDTQQIKNVISRLRREYPALVITVKNDNPAEKPAKDEKNDDNKPQNQGDGQPQEPAKTVTPMSKDDFVAGAKANKAAGNKWTVKVEGMPFEVQEAADKAAAIESAYVLYLETSSNPNKGEDNQQ